MPIIIKMPSSVPSTASDPSDVSNNRAPIYLNVYDITNLNGYLYWLGLGIFHSGVEVYGVVYAFGAHNYPGFMYRRTITIVTMDKGPIQVQNFIEQLSLKYAGDSNHLIGKNCNHFTNVVCLSLTKRPALGWVNRLAHIGAFCSCLLPESLQTITVRQSPEYLIYDDENGEEDDHLPTIMHVDYHHEQGQRLLTVPNGNVQSLMQDRFHDAVTAKRSKDVL